MDFSLPANAPMLLAFAKLPDPRKERNRLYPLIDTVAVVLMGVVCGANDIMAAYLWAQHRKERFVSMGLWLNGLPSYDTLNRVFRFLDPKAFNCCFLDLRPQIHLQRENTDLLGKSPGVLGYDIYECSGSGRKTDPSLCDVKKQV